MASKNRDAEALDILEKLNGREHANQVLQDVKQTLHTEKGTVAELFAPGLRTAMIIGLFLALFSQITGINAIIYYAPEIFKSVGFGSNSALMQTVVIGITNTLFTFVAIRLIDRAGRRKLLLWGVSGMTICLIAVGIVYYLGFSNGPLLLIFILGFIASFAFSLGPIPWVIISEIFPTKTRGIAMSFATFTLWIGVVLVTQLTPVLLATFGGAVTFWIFGGNALLMLLFTYKMIPETKGKTLEEIEKYWTKH